jgi:hypothetical protein
MTAVFENLQSSKRYYPMISLNSSEAIYGFPPRPKHPALPNSRIVNGSNGRGNEQPYKESSCLSNQPPDPATVTLNTAHQPGRLDHHEQGPSLTVKRNLPDESDSKMVDCKKLKISQLVESPAVIETSFLAQNRGILAHGDNNYDAGGV